MSAGTNAERRRREHALRSYYDDEVSSRAVRALAPERVVYRDRFVRLLRAERRRSILEVGCGPGRDGVPFAQAGFNYVGVDFAPQAIKHCRRLGLSAEQASALDLPFHDASFDAAWTMSTLLHLDDDDLQIALAELARVLPPHAPVAIGLWGGRPRHVLHSDADSGRPARFFAIRSDDALRRSLEQIGSVEAFATWAHPNPRTDELHYQFAIVRIGGSQEAVS